MKKHNSKFSLRSGASAKTGTNYAPMLAHRWVNDKGFQLGANALLRKLLAPFMPQKMEALAQ